MTEAGWTAEVPKEIGVYWWRSNAADNHPWIVRVHKGWLGLMLMQTMGGPLVTIGDGGEWLGPLSPTDRQQGKVEGIQESKNLVSEFIEAWLLAGMVAKLLTPAVHEAVGGLSRDLRRELQKIEQAAQGEKVVE